MKFLLLIISISTAALQVSAQTGNLQFSRFHQGYTAEEKTIYYRLGEGIIPIRIFQFGEIKNIICINLHDNESTSFDAAKTVLQQTGGTLIKIENGFRHMVHFNYRGTAYVFDPNGIFSRQGIEKTLKENSRVSPAAVKEVEKFAKRILELLPRSISCIIALHNNADGDYSARSYLGGHERQNEARAVHLAGLEDEDDLVFTTDSLLYKKISALGYNSIWQDIRNAGKDGSLSVYCGEKGIRYVNIETEHGKTDHYAEMLERLLQILAIENHN